MFKKIMVLALVVVFGVLVSGCAVVGAVGIGYTTTKDAGIPSPVVEVGEVKMKTGANVSFLKTANFSSVAFEKDMTTLNTSPGPNDAKVNTAAADEVKRSLGIPGNAISPATVRLKTYFGEINPWGWSGYYYWNITEKNTLTYSQVIGVKKLVNAHFILEQGGDALLEVHGLWAGDDNADEIAGARQLAKEIVSEVMKKLSVASAPPRESVAEAEAKKE